MISCNLRLKMATAALAALACGSIKSAGAAEEAWPVPSSLPSLHARGRIQFPGQLGISVKHRFGAAEGTFRTWALADGLVNAVELGTYRAVWAWRGEGAEDDGDDRFRFWSSEPFWFGAWGSGDELPRDVLAYDPLLFLLNTTELAAGDTERVSAGLLADGSSAVVVKGPDEKSGDSEWRMSYAMAVENGSVSKGEIASEDVSPQSAGSKHLWWRLDFSQYPLTGIKLPRRMRAKSERWLGEHVLLIDALEVLPAGTTVRSLVDPLTRNLQRRYRLSGSVDSAASGTLDKALPLLDGGSASLRELTRGKVTLLHFWASDAPDSPSDESMGKKIKSVWNSVLAASRAYSGDPMFQVIGVSFDADPERARDHAASRGADWRQIVVPRKARSAITGKYNVKELPEVALILPDGSVDMTGGMDRVLGTDKDFVSNASDNSWNSNIGEVLAFHHLARKLGGQSRAYFGEKAVNVLLKPDRVEAFWLHRPEPDRLKPLDSSSSETLCYYPIERKAGAISRKDASRIAGLALDDKVCKSGGGDCFFEPSAAFRFSRGSSTVTLVFRQFYDEFQTNINIRGTSGGGCLMYSPEGKKEFLKILRKVFPEKKL